jgi:cobalamin biosynthesis protein CobT
MAIRTYDFEEDTDGATRPRPVDPRVMRSIKIDSATDARARRAEAAFNAMLPSLTGFAKMITGRNIKVISSPGTPCTDNKVIYLRPPIELGDRLAHLGGNKCDLRDSDTDRPLCAACCAREDVLITLYHEISHIAFDSFDLVSDEDKARLIERAVAESVEAIRVMRADLYERLEAAQTAGDTALEEQLLAESDYLVSKAATREEKIAERLSKLTVKDYMTAAAVVSPYLPMMVNALEDVRVNHAMYQARPGTYRMFRGQAIRIFGEGIQNDDGTFRMWKDMPRNAQMIVALLAKAAGYAEYRDGWFTDEVTDALSDPELEKLLAQVATLNGPGDVYNLAFPVLERIRKLGFCKARADLEDDPKPEPKPEPSGKAEKREDEDGEAEPEDGDGEGEGAGGGVPEDDEEDGGSSSGGSPSTGSGSDEPATTEPTEPEGSGTEPEPTEGEPTEPTTEDEDKPTEPEGEPEPEDKPTGGIGWDGEDDAEGKGHDSDETKASDDPEADAAEAENAMRIFGGHGPIPMTPQKEMDEAAIDRAIVQAGDFDAPSRNIFGVNVHRYDKHIIEADGTDRTEGMAWNKYFLEASASSHFYRDYYGMELTKIPEGVLGPSLIRMRAAFANNKLAAVQRDLKTGKLDRSVLARRISTGDPRLFKRTAFPGKKDYEVVIGLDVSGSTGGGAIALTKQAALAQAELLHRCGVRFSIYAHSGNLHSGAYDRSGGLDVDIFVAKDANDAWDSKARERLAALTPASANLDGHTLEWYRKRLDESSATDRIIMYYTDGAMPCENMQEELTILQREIKTCERKGYTLMAVGIGNDDPIRHGLDTVRIDTIEELPKVVRHLEKRLSVRRAS